MKKLLLSALFTTVVSSTGCSNYSEGDRVGVITKFSKKGLIFKSWEGSINQGGTKQVSDADGNMSTVTNAIGFNVSSDDKVIIAKVKKASETGRRVKITYSQWYMKPPTIDNSRVITNLEFL